LVGLKPHNPSPSKTKPELRNPMDTLRHEVPYKFTGNPKSYLTYEQPPDKNTEWTRKVTHGRNRHWPFVSGTNWQRWTIRGTGENSDCSMQARVAAYSCPGHPGHFTKVMCAAYPWKGGPANDPTKLDHRGKIQVNQCPANDNKHSTKYYPKSKCTVAGIDKQCIAELCADTQCPDGRFAASFGTAPSPDMPSKCTAWFLKADAAIRIKWNFIKQFELVRNVRNCFPWFASGSPKYRQGGCHATNNPGERISTVHRRRGHGNKNARGCANAKK